jgi:hypothetical protein
MPDNFDETKDFLLLQPDNQPNLSPELEKSIGEALTKMLDPKLSIMTGELEQYERVCMSALFMRSIKLYKKGEENNLYSRYLTDYIIRTVPYKRKRAVAMTEILKNIVGYGRMKVHEGIRSKLGL